jgi:hypothetical protein
VRLVRTPAPWILVCLVCLVALVASCDMPARLHMPGAQGGRAETWIVARDSAVARGVTAPTAPAVVARATGSRETPEVLPISRTRVTAMMVGPIATIDRTKTYEGPGGAHDLLVSFTPPATPARQDYLVHVGDRTLTVLVRERADADALARTQPGASLVATDRDGLVAIPVGTSTTRAVELDVETTGFVPWRDGAYELTVPRAFAGDVALTADVFGPGPIVVVSSPSHAIDAVPESLGHLRVGLRDPGTLREDDFVLRYRIDPADSPGAFVIAPDGGGDVVGVVVHPFEDTHEPVAVSDVSIDWNGAPVTEIRPATIGPLAAGSPLVVLARARGDVRGPILLRVRIGREVRTVALARADTIPGDGLRALPLLWARAGRPTVAAHR